MCEGFFLPPLGDAGMTLMSTEAGTPNAESPWSFSKSSERVDPKRTEKHTFFNGDKHDAEAHHGASLLHTSISFESDTNFIPFEFLHHF